MSTNASTPHAQSTSTDPRTLLSLRGVRVTEPRLCVLSLLMRTEGPVTIETLATTLAERVNMVTVYRTVTLFIGANLIEATVAPDGARLVEFQRTHHHHVRCTHCGKGEELLLDDLEERLMKKAQGAGKGFARIDRHVLEFFGTCRACARMG